MCTLLLLRQLVERYPIFLVMNRDEAYRRPSEDPSLTRDGRTIVAPRDLQAGGTWIGVNDLGLVVAISNRHEGTFDSSRRSRGLLCLEALERTSALDVKDFVERELLEVEYNPFNLLYCDLGRAFVTHHAAETRTVELRREVHFLTNMDVDDTDRPRIRRAMEVVEGRDKSTVEAALEVLKSVASDHEVYEGQSICLHKEHAGTVSSTIIAVSHEFPRTSLFLHSIGRPCEASYEDYSSLLEEMVS
ncbi:MAG: NRDE family protein [Thermoplasmata archaeon]